MSNIDPAKLQNWTNETAATVNMLSKALTETMDRVNDQEERIRALEKCIVDMAGAFG